MIFIICWQIKVVDKVSEYDKKTEELIKSYLNFSPNKFITVDEYIKFRKQAIKETKDVVVVQPIIDKTPPEKKEINERHIKQETIIATSKPATETKMIEQDNDVVVENKNVNNVESMFLSMIKEIQD